MEKKEQHIWPEVILSSNEKSFYKTIQKDLKSGVLRKIAPKIYTSNLKDTPEMIIKRHTYQILSHLFPGGVISYRSAFEGGVSPDGFMVITYKYTKSYDLPGLQVRLIAGPGPDPYDMPFLENLYISSRSRVFLENLQPSRNRSNFQKSVTKKQLEERLDHIVRVYGPEELNKIRDQAKEIAERLGMEEECSRLDKMISAFLGTHSPAYLETESGRSRSKGEPYDPYRVELFAILSAYLQHKELPVYQKNALSSNARINLAFFESYFSNYIEGTIFQIEEAEKIIFENKIFAARPEDSHDVLSTYQIVSNRQWMESVPLNFEKFISILQHRHSVLMEARPVTLPGFFKNIPNRAGNTVFVKPEEVRGTLSRGFEFYSNLESGLARAIFMKFLISEVHPFMDGNGRIARILMNAELDVTGLSRIIIPTAYRDDYLLSLRKLSRAQDPDPYVRMLIGAQKYTSGILFDDYRQALAYLQATNAFLEPSEGKLRFTPI